MGSLAGNNIVADTISWGVYGQGFASNSADPSYFDGFMQAMMIRNDHPSDQDILMFASLDGINLNDNNLLSYLQPIGNETSLIEDQSNSNNDGIMSSASVSSNCVQQ